MSVLRATTISDLAGTGPATLTKQSAAKAWVRTTGTGTPAIAVSFNVASVVDYAAGDMGANYTSAFSVVPCSLAVGEMTAFAGMQQVIGIGTTAVRVKVHNTSAAGTDPIGHHISSFGDLA